MTDRTADIIKQEPGFSDFFALLKPRVMSLVIFTALVGFIVAPGDIHPVVALGALICIAVGAGASGALNMWWDADIDAVMTRTKTRPIPAGLVSKSGALGIGIVLSIMSVAFLSLFTNVIAAGLLAFTIFFYAVIYTMWLKRSTPQNIVIGGAAGAFPPMIGWAAVTGGVSIESILLFGIIFLWTPPHFWALAIFKNDDYTRAKIPMLPVVAGDKATRFQIILYTVLLVAISIAPLATGLSGPISFAAIVVLNSGFVFFAVKVFFRTADSAIEDGFKAEKKLFGFSILYLFLLFAAFAADALIFPNAPIYLNLGL